MSDRLYAFKAGDEIPEHIVRNVQCFPETTRGKFSFCQDTKVTEYPDKFVVEPLSMSEALFSIKGCVGRSFEPTKDIFWPDGKGGFKAMLGCQPSGINRPSSTPTIPE
jgi:hypothetical protein